MIYDDKGSLLFSYSQNNLLVNKTAIELIEDFISSIKYYCDDLDGVAFNIPKILSEDVPDYDYYSVQGLQKCGYIGLTVATFKTEVGGGIILKK